MDSRPVGPCERRTREAPVWFGPSGGYLMRASPDPFPLPKNRQQKQYAARVAASWLGPALLSFQSDLRNSGEAESSRRRRRYVNNATTHKGAAVVDGQDDRTSTTFVRDPHFAAERQRAVCGGERRAIELLTACGSASAFVGIDRGEAGLICCRWCEMNGANLTS